MKVKLKVLVGKSEGKEIPVPGPRFLIGRSSDCHLRPKSDSISRNHCTILIREDKVTVRDLNSRNGTFVNGERITEEEEIRDGDQLQVGKLEFGVVVKAAKKEVADAPKPKAEEEVESPTETIMSGGEKDPDSLEFDVTEWLQEADKDDKNNEPETRQFQLDDTDRLAVATDAPSEPEEEEEAAVTKHSKKKPGKLPPRPAAQTDSSRDAAADMLRKFFNSR